MSAPDEPPELEAFPNDGLGRLLGLVFIALIAMVLATLVGVAAGMIWLRLFGAS